MLPNLQSDGTGKEHYAAACPIAGKQGEFGDAQLVCRGMLGIKWKKKRFFPGTYP